MDPPALHLAATPRLCQRGRCLFPLLGQEEVIEARRPGSVAELQADSQTPIRIPALIVMMAATLRVEQPQVHDPADRAQ